MKKNILLISTLFTCTIFCTTIFAQAPANDECGGAIAVTTNPFGTTCTTLTAGTTNNATTSPFVSTCAAGFADDDVWYSFVANSQSAILRATNIVNVTSGNAGMSYAVSAGCPTGLNQIACEQNFAFGVAGLTYFVRFWSANNSTFINFNFCIQDAPPPPANDECSAAIPLIINPFGTSCTNTTNVVTNGATQSPFTPLTCTSIDNDNNDDVWYSFVATSQSVILRASNIISSITGSNASAAYALYQSACPGSAATFSCDGQFAFSAGHRIISGLTIGNTYFLRLWVQGTHNYGSIDICVQETPPPPSNNECSAAIPLTINPFGTSCTATTTVVTNGATQSSFNPASCTSIDNNDDLWYSFVATSQSILLRASNIVNTVVGGNAGAGYALYEAVCPNSTTAFSCDAGFAFGGGHRIISGLTIGNTYFLRLWVQGNHNYGSMNICVQETPPPPANDECTGAIPVSLTLPGTLCVSSIFANTSGATLSANSPSCVSINFNNDDTWYSFTASSGTAILRYSNCFETTTTAGAGLGYALYNSCPSGNASLLCSNNFGFINGFTTLTGLTAGNVYLLRLFGSNSNNYVSFNFCIQSPLQNDECINAITLPVTNGFCTSPVIASLNGATTSAGFTSPTCRIGGPTSDVWFKTTVPATGNVIIQTSAVKTAGNDLVMTAYTGASGTLTQIACDDDGNPETFPSASHSRITLTGRTTGETIMLRVTAVTSANEEQFAICAWDETTSVLPLITAGGNCITGNAKIIDSAQGNIYMWVPIFDNSGNIIAEVYSNGNDLGLITPNLFVNSGAVRQFGSRFYLDRNMAIQSANSITNPVKLRLYLKQTELSALQAVDPSVSGITQLKITKTNTLCQSAYSGSPTVISQEANSNYGVNYYLQYSTNGFSSFYLDGLSGVLPLKFIQFTVLRIQTGVSINWTVVKDSSIYSFEVEKSENGIQFHTIASAKRDEFISKRNGNWNYTITDALANNIVFYYRIKLIDINGRIIYSKVKKLNAAKKENLFLSVYPNPANKGITIEFNNISNETAIISIFDISGRKLKQFQQINLNGKIILNISDFKAGIYLMKIDIGGRTYQKKFIK